MKKLNLNFETVLGNLVKCLDSKNIDSLFGLDIDGDMCFITDWNDPKIPKNLEAWLYSMNVITMYHDEYVICDNCNRIVTTKHRSYHDELEYQMIGNDYAVPVCIKCLKQNLGWQLEDCMNDFHKTLKRSFMPEQFLVHKGFKKYNEEYYASGMHQGMNDSPEAIIKKLDKEFKYAYDYVFRITEIGQFHTYFDLWIKEK